ncbi:MAG TPA: SDR family oxidoreductase [Mycobacteriales bacterium]|nr:SDR family oxidoreductase [Mycobacteriales bacterium]
MSEKRAAERRPVTIVTGGGRGIGAATALYLARAGHDVAICFRRDADSARQVVDDAARLGAASCAVRADVTREADVDRLFARAQDELGAVTGLVNNAGATGMIADLVDTPVATLRGVIELNLVGTLLCCRRAAHAMSTRHGGGGGAIVNVSSSAATLGSPHQYVHYAAAKAGVDTLTVGLAQELAAEGIRVNAVAPGMVRTRIHADAGDASRIVRLAPTVPLGRPGEPEEIAPAIGWLLSAEASYATGAILRVAGGR